MIRIYKNLDDIPQSLKDRKTDKRRNTCIRDSKYHQNKNFHDRYKQKDIQEKLAKVYKNKCVFCEQKIEKCTTNKLEECSSTVEHYRPKSKYYWLPYSWDNLLWCCHRCNQNKKNKFETKNALGTFRKTSFLKKIHSTSKIYNRIEKPLMINPEIESVISKLTFYNGKIDSTDERVKYTIETCMLDRDNLNEARKTIIDTIKNRVDVKKLLNEDSSEILKELIEDIKSKEKTFIALRYWILQNRADILGLN